MYVKDNIGTYVMQVASTLTGLHPQTLRKYERAGLINPARRKAVRFYSNDDITRLRMIKHLIDDNRLNIAGARLALNIWDKLLAFKEVLATIQLDDETGKRINNMIDEILNMISK